MAQANLSNKLAGFSSSALFTLTALALIWAVTSTDRTVSPIFAYVGGVVVAITPCCLPIFFFITSLAVKERRRRDAILVAMSFSAGLALITAILGVGLALTGILFRLPDVSGIVFAIGGGIGYAYAISQLFGFTLPSLGLRIPFLKKSKNSYVSAFTSGLLLGTGEIGCPNPFRYVLFSFIAASGNLVSGAYLGFLYGLGAITPLILVVLLALLGINLTTSLTRHTAKIEKIINLSFIPIGAFLVTYGVFGDNWYESTVLHDIWEHVLLKFNLIQSHSHLGGGGVLYILGNVTLLLMITIPIVLYFFKNRRGHLIRLDTRRL